MAIPWTTGTSTEIITSVRETQEKAYSVIGKPALNVEASEKARGEACFTGDMKLPGMLYGKIKRSPHPFAKIISIDTSKALKLPGVRAVIIGSSGITAGSGSITAFVYHEYGTDDATTSGKREFYFELDELTSSITAPAL